MCDLCFNSIIKCLALIFWVTEMRGGKGGGCRKYAKAVNEGPEVTINKYKKARQQQNNI